MRGRVAPKAPSRLRRFDHAEGKRHIVLGAEHPAIQEGRTLFPSTRRAAGDAPRLLKSGHNSRKIGKQVTKGKWRGFPIYTLTLPERETCPETCAHWASCYGNHMPFAERIIADQDFEPALWIEIEKLNRKHRRGFVVRLHVLGDFYSVGYVRMWERALKEFPGLRVFGYTANPTDEPIGAALWQLSVHHWDRFAMRFSGRDRPERGAVTIEKGADSEHVACPAQRGQTECCGTCGFCWQSKRTVAFERH